MMLRITPGTVTNSPITGESTKEPVKTILAGKAGDVRQTCGDLSACFLFCTRSCGLRWRPGFPCALSFEGHEMRKARAECVARARSYVLRHSGAHRQVRTRNPSCSRT